MDDISAALEKLDEAARVLREDAEQAAHALSFLDRQPGETVTVLTLQSARNLSKDALADAAESNAYLLRRLLNRT